MIEGQRRPGHDKLLEKDYAESLFLNAETTDECVREVNSTFGLLYEQEERYSAAIKALQNGLDEPEGEIKALKRDIERREALYSLLKHVKTETAVPNMKELLTSTFEVPPARLDREMTLGNMILVAEEAVGNMTDEQASRVLELRAEASGFRYAPAADPRKELQQYLDFRINALQVRLLVSALHAAMSDGSITDRNCEAITGHIRGNNTSKVGLSGTNARIVESMKKAIRGLEGFRADTPLVYLSIGCGDGSSDVLLCTELKKLIPGLQLQVIGLDPYATHTEENPIVKSIEEGGLGGRIVNRAFGDGETVYDLIGCKPGKVLAVALDRYSVHHLGESIEAVLRKLPGIPLVSADEPIAPEQRLDFGHRLTKIAWDLLANYAFEAVASKQPDRRPGELWILKALHNPDIFKVLYPRTEDLEARGLAGELEYVPVGKNLNRRNGVITYLPKSFVAAGSQS